MLGEAATDAPVAMVPLVLAYLRVARWFGMPASPPRSAYARALFAVENNQAQLSHALEHLDDVTLRNVLLDVVAFVDERHVVELADALTLHEVVPSPASCARVAALLARRDLSRCLALLARLGRTTDAQRAHALSVAAAYLASGASGDIPSELRAAWHDLRSRPADAVWAADLAAAQLAVAAVEETPQRALALLEAAIAEYPAVELGDAPARVVAAAIKTDREGVLALVEGWPARRAVLLEAIAHAEPAAPELASNVDAVLHAWRHKPGVDRTPAGTIETAAPLLATTITMRDPARARRVAAELQPSRFTLRNSTWAAMREWNLADETWRPSVWDELVSATDADDELAVPTISDEVYAAWWKLETLPLTELPWFNARSLW